MLADVACGQAVEGVIRVYSELGVVVGEVESACAVGGLKWL